MLKLTVFLTISIFIILNAVYLSESDNVSPYFAGGSYINISDCSYQVSIQYSFYGHVCGGAIISNEWILTTARCVNNFQKDGLSIIVNTTSLDKVNNVYGVIQVVIHPNFDNSPLPDYDIALLQVEQINFGDDIIPATLPQQDTYPSLKRPCLLTGWGAQMMGGDIPWDLQSLDQQLLNFAACSYMYFAVTNETLQLPNTTLCATNTPPFAYNLGPCVGEWGSPLVCEDTETNTNELLGLVSGDILLCGRFPAPNLYTRVSSFRDWIRDVSEV